MSCILTACLLVMLLVGGATFAKVVVVGIGIAYLLDAVELFEAVHDCLDCLDCDNM